MTTRARHLHIEPTGGLSGDILLGALLDLEDERFGLAQLEALAQALVPGECELALSRTRRGGFAAARLEVRTPESGQAPARGLTQLTELLERADLSEAVRGRTLGVLRRIGEAEASVHGIELERVHFHEVGAVDTLIDVAGAMLALECLQVESVSATPPLVGEGTVRCAHGELPVPAPATARLLIGMPSVLGGGPGERLTPTGAALLAELVDVFEAPGALELEAVGCGAGARDPELGPANLARVLLGRRPSAGASARPRVWLGAFNLDDTTAEEIGFAIGALRGAGALEVWTSAAQMKKDRPGTVVSFLCRAELRAALERAALAHTPTLGLRWSEHERLECARELLELELHGERVRVVLRRPPAGVPTRLELDASVEYDDLAALARKTGRSLRELEREAWALLSARE